MEIVANIVICLLPCISTAQEVALYRLILLHVNPCERKKPNRLAKSIDVRFDKRKKKKEGGAPDSPCPMPRISTSHPRVLAQAISSVWYDPDGHANVRVSPDAPPTTLKMPTCSLRAGRDAQVSVRTSRFEFSRRPGRRGASASAHTSSSTSTTGPSAEGARASEQFSIP